MNSKESFLKELQSGLAVLAESEQQDILAEYAQHIDMRMAGGLTEEEAVQDFGDIRQLTAEILAAYHVNPTYAAGGGSTVHLPNPRSALIQAGNWFRAAIHGLGNAFSRLGRAVAALPRHVSGWIHSLVHRKTSQKLPVAEREAHTMDSIKRASTPICGAGPALKRFFRKVGHGIVLLCRLAAWLAWNGTLLLCALPFAAAGLFALVCLGLLVVWLAQGLPLTGAMLGCIGILAFCAGVLGLGSGLIWHRPKPAAPTPNESGTAQTRTMAAQPKLAETEGMQDDAE